MYTALGADVHSHCVHRCTLHIGVHCVKVYTVHSVLVHTVYGYTMCIDVHCTRTIYREKRMAKKYYDKLFKEYCITDLSRYKENKVSAACSAVQCWTTCWLLPPEVCVLAFWITTDCAEVENREGSGRGKRWDTAIILAHFDLCVFLSVLRKDPVPPTHQFNSTFMSF